MAVREHLLEQASLFKRADFSPIPGPKDAAIRFMAWVIPATLLVLVDQVVQISESKTYMDMAFEEGAGPRLWNVIGLIGFSLLGLCIVFPKNKRLSLSASRTLLTLYDIGALSAGLILGSILTVLLWSNSSEPMFWMIGTATTGMWAIFCGLNVVGWYTASIIYNDDGPSSLMNRLGKVDRPLRITAGLALTAIMLGLILILMRTPVEIR